MLLTKEDYESNPEIGRGGVCDIQDEILRGVTGPLYLSTQLKRFDAATP